MSDYVRSNLIKRSREEYTPDAEDDNDTQLKRAATVDSVASILSTEPPKETNESVKSSPTDITIEVCKTTVGIEEEEKMVSPHYCYPRDLVRSPLYVTFNNQNLQTRSPVAGRMSREECVIRIAGFIEYTFEYLEGMGLRQEDKNAYLRQRIESLYEISKLCSPEDAYLFSAPETLLKDMLSPETTVVANQVLHYPESQQMSNYSTPPSPTLVSRYNSTSYYSPTPSTCTRAQYPPSPTHGFYIPHRYPDSPARGIHLSPTHPTSVTSRMHLSPTFPPSPNHGMYVPLSYPPSPTPGMHSPPSYPPSPTPGVYIPQSCPTSPNPRVSDIHQVTSSTVSQSINNDVTNNSSTGSNNTLVDRYKEMVTLCRDTISRLNQPDNQITQSRQSADGSIDNHDTGSNTSLFDRCGEVFTVCKDLLTRLDQRYNQLQHQTQQQQQQQPQVMVQLNTNSTPPGTTINHYADTNIIRSALQMLVQRRFQNISSENDATRGRNNKSVTEIFSKSVLCDSLQELLDKAIEKDRVEYERICNLYPEDSEGRMNNTCTICYDGPQSVYGTDCSCVIGCVKCARKIAQSKNPSCPMCRANTSYTRPNKQTNY